MNDVQTARPTTLRINCPKCGATDTPAKAVEEVERLYGYMRLVPFFFRKRTTWVVCQNCHAKLLSKLSLAELEGKSARELEAALSPRVFLITQVLAILAILLAVIPFVGTVAGLIAVVVNWRSRDWRRTVSLVGLALSIVFPLAFVAALKLTGQ